MLGDTRLVSSKMRVTGCFGGPLVVARDSSVALTTSHTTVAEASGRSLDQASWPVDVVEAATELVEGGNNARTAAAGRLGVIGDADAAPLLAYALGDPEWDVRAAALEALSGSAAPIRDCRSGWPPASATSPRSCATWPGRCSRGRRPRT